MSLRVAALLTCHDRRDSTLGCLRALAAQRVEGADLHAYVVDAASSDGTVEAVAAEFPDATVIRGTADLYWSGGMRVALAHAMRDNADVFLWLNDDTMLDVTAVHTLLETERCAERSRRGCAIVVGATRDPLTGALTYGGVYRPAPRTRPLRFELVQPTHVPRPCETMNGNCVLIRREIVRQVGNLDPAFTHGIGDFDYGLRARQRGYSIWLAPGTIGTCQRNQRSSRGNLRSDVRSLTGPKGLPFLEWARFARRWGGPLWAVYVLSPYIRWGIRRLKR